MRGTAMFRIRAAKKSVTWFAAGALLLVAAMPAMAADEVAGDEWKISASVYLFGAEIDGTTNTGGDINMPFSDLLKNLNMAYMGTFEARKGNEPWSLFTDIVYLNVGADKGDTEHVPILEGNHTIKVDVDTKIGLKAWILTFAGTYHVFENEKVTLDLMAGARYFWLNVKLDLNLGILNTSRQPKVDETDHVWDAIVGVRGKIKLDDKWFMPYHADIGGGGSQLTWQAFLGVGYNYKWGEVVLGYRYMDYNFKSGWPVEDLTFGGPLLGAKYHF